VKDEKSQELNLLPSFIQKLEDGLSLKIVGIGVMMFSMILMKIPCTIQLILATLCGRE
jgi:hypothetical protein